MKDREPAEMVLRDHLLAVSAPASYEIVTNTDTEAGANRNMKDYEYIVSLRFWHPTIDPREISSELGRQPGRQVRIGEPRKTPKGRLLEGTQRESYWSMDVSGSMFQPTTSLDAEAVIAMLLKELTPHMEFLVGLHKSGGKGVIQLTSSSARSYAIELPPEMLHQCSQLGLGLAHEVDTVSGSPAVPAAR
jgi:hypothetical protein